MNCNRCFSIPPDAVANMTDSSDKTDRPGSGTPTGAKQEGARPERKTVRGDRPEIPPSPGSSPQGQPSPHPGAQRSGPSRRGPLQWMILFILGLSLLMLMKAPWSEQQVITFTTFMDQLEGDNIAKVTIQGRQRIVGTFRQPIPTPPESGPVDAPESGEGLSPEDGPEGRQLEPGQEAVALGFQCNLPPQVGEGWLDKLHAQGVQVDSVEPTNTGELLMIASTVLLLVLLIGAWTMMRRARDQGFGGGMLTQVTKSPARRYDADDQSISFADVAGLEGVKKDLQEVVQFLKEPEKFHRLGAQIPKGVLLMGPPGTGKTLLGRAVAGEAGVPFFSINGSEFIQLFVGVGAGRVRDMFKTAQESAPSILFIDEIDAVGRQRGAGLGGGHDEREQTLNQILSEMDGFSPNSSVIVIAATNRPDVLDPALLRPGRFDRHVTVDRPTINGRRELFELHSLKVPITEEVDFKTLARATVGLTGADIRNLVNEAALWATRNDKDKVDMDDFEYARDKVLMGAKRDDVLTVKEKEITAVHEAGHALLAWLLPGSDRVHKVTIIPRGRALGVTQLVPEEDRHNMGQHEMVVRLTMLLGGRSAEKMRFDQYSAGAENDLKEATSLARRMMTRWGMSERLGPVAYIQGEDQPFLGREIGQEHRNFSERSAQVIDEEVAKILHAAADRANRILTEHRDKLDRLTAALLESEVLDEEEIAQLIGPMVGQHKEATSTEAVSAATSGASRTQA
jgi:cell division protease FtsH